jgi:hypothetical protein
MTNVDSVHEKTSVVDKKTNIGYLTAVFPHKYGYARRVAERLNTLKKRTIMDRAYSANIVYQVIDKGYDDLNVEPELVKMVEEYTGLPIAKACPKYVA